MSQRPTVIDCAKELEALEETWKGVQERAAVHLVLMTDELAKAQPILPAGKHMRKSMEHSLGVLIELNGMTIGIMEGLMQLLQAQLEQHKERNDGQEGTSDQFVH